MASMGLIAQSRAATVRMLTVIILTASVLMAVRTATKAPSVKRVSLCETSQSLKKLKEAYKGVALLSITFLKM